jgi:valyl-tRNA synthetase
MSDAPSKSYDPAANEKRIFDKWESAGVFRAQPDDRQREQRFCMVIPPPNVTGALHLGHALNNTLQDILIRQKRMAGFNSFWLVGTDHAGIATQATVEKTIRKEEGKSRHDLGREELVKRIWEWKEKFGGRIIQQLRLMGCSCDYSRERFTLDEGCAKAVRETFFKMFRDGLIYRGKRLVNWDTQLQTAVADDEVYHEEVKGHFYHFKYPIVGPQPGEPTHVHIATTRPETMLGDTAVAVHPDPAGALDKAQRELREKLAEASEKDKAGIAAQIDDIDERRTTHLPTLLKLRDMAKAGRRVCLPLVDREIPLICDEWAQPALGTGCVKITPAHDVNDYEVGKRHDLEMRNVMTADGRVSESGGKYAGQKFADARKNVVADLEALGLVEKIEDRLIDLAHSDRSNQPIEPYLSDQWFVKMGDLEPEHAAKIEGLRNRAAGFAQMGLDAVKRGEVKFHPPRYEKTYTDWLGEKRDWCISRQLWWGHRIPVWHNNEPFEEDQEKFDLIIRKLRVLEENSLISISEFATFEGTKPPKISQAQWVGEYPGLPVRICIRSESDDQTIKYLESLGYRQDPDVLDTWFSSALWPHSTLGWPEPEKHDNLLSYYYPTQVLSTAREIITLWVARMVMTGLYNIGELPFRDVFIHPLIQDGQGRKMSKTLGNGVDPVDIIDEYGADALRFTMAELTTETQDIRLPVKKKKLPDGREINISEKFEKGRNFCNKLWQASTGFVMRNLDGYAPRAIDAKSLRLEDRWILSRMTACLGGLDAALAEFRFSEAAGVTYRFMWDEYCSWYIEMAKSRLVTPPQPSPYQGEGATPPRPSPCEGEGVEARDRQTAQQVLVHVLDQLIRMLHPIIPFVTESVWEQLNQAAPNRGLKAPARCEGLLISAAWPRLDASLRDETAEAEMAVLQEVIKAVRDIRTTVNDQRSKAKQPAVKTLPLVVVTGDQKKCAQLQTHRAFVMKLANCDDLRIESGAAKPAGAMSRQCGGMILYAPVGDLVNLSSLLEGELSRVEELAGAVSREQARLSNQDFVSRADPGVVAQAKERLAELSSRLDEARRYVEELR